MKIHEDRSHMNIDTRWFEKGYIKEDVHSLRLQSLAPKQRQQPTNSLRQPHPRRMGSVYPPSKFGEQRSNETRHGSYRTGLCLLPV